nr:hypothetical protein [uncultured Campylobacter sp.]
MVNLSHKYSEQYGERLAGKANRGGETAKFKIADGRRKQRMKVRLNLIDTSTVANLHSKWLNCGHERRASKTTR